MNGDRDKIQFQVPSELSAAMRVCINVCRKTKEKKESVFDGYKENKSSSAVGFSTFNSKLNLQMNKKQ